MPPEPTYEVLSVEWTSPDDCFFLDAWNRSFEGSVARLNDSLGRLVTLSTAMAGGALVLLKENICYGWSPVIAAGLFFLALGVAVAGAVPKAVAMTFDPRSIREGFCRTAVVKRRWVVASSSLLAAGLFAAIVGAALQYAH